MRYADSETPVALKIIIFYLMVFTLAFVFFAPRAFSAGAEAKDCAGESAAVRAGETSGAEAKERTMPAAIMRREKELNERDEALRLKEERLTALKADIERKTAELASIHLAIESTVKKIDEESGERVRRIVKIYESMPPEEVAQRIDKLSEHIAVMLLSRMSEKKAAKVLGLVDAEKSVRLTKLLNTNTDN